MKVDSRRAARIAGAGLHLRAASVSETASDCGRPARRPARPLRHATTWREARRAGGGGPASPDMMSVAARAWWSLRSQPEIRALQVRQEYFKLVSFVGRGRAPPSFVSSSSPTAARQESNRSGTGHLSGVTGGPLLYRGRRGGLGADPSGRARPRGLLHCAGVEPEPSETTGALRGLAISVAGRAHVRHRPQLSMPGPQPICEQQRAQRAGHDEQKARAGLVSTCRCGHCIRLARTGTTRGACRDDVPISPMRVPRCPAPMVGCLMNRAAWWPAPHWRAPTGASAGDLRAVGAPAPTRLRAPPPIYEMAGRARPTTRPLANWPPRPADAQRAGDGTVARGTIPRSWSLAARPSPGYLENLMAAREGTEVGVAFEMRAQRRTVRRW